MFKVTDERVKLHEVQPSKQKYVDEFAMKVTLLNYPDMDKVKDYVPEMAMSTWNDANINKFNKTISEEDKARFLFRTLQGKFIPTIMKTMNVTFRVENISFHDVTHLIRHSGFSFAADCTGDKIIKNRPVILPEVVKDANCEDKYKTAIKLLDECYADIINAGGHIQDARMMLPRTITTFYYVTGTLDYTLQFIRQRLDRQVQPKSDNIMAIKLLLELCDKIPQLYFLVDANGPSAFYTKLLKTNFVSRFEKPLPCNSMNAEEEAKYTYIYDTPRDEMIGNKNFVKKYTKLLKEFETRKTEYAENHPEIIDILNDCTIGDWK